MVCALATNATISAPCGPNNRCASNSRTTRNAFTARLLGNETALGFHTTPTGLTSNNRAGHKNPVHSDADTDTDR
jgi:hypothetical protein